MFEENGDSLFEPPEVFNKQTIYIIEIVEKYLSVFSFQVKDYNWLFSLVYQSNAVNVFYFLFILYFADNISDSLLSFSLTIWSISSHEMYLISYMCFILCYRSKKSLMKWDTQAYRLVSYPKQLRFSFLMLLIKYYWGTSG